MNTQYYSLDGVPEDMKSQFEAESIQLKLAVTNAIIGYLGGDPKEKNNPEQEGIYNQALLNYLCMSIPKPEWGYGQSYALERHIRNRNGDVSIKNQLSFFEESIIGALENFSQIQGSGKLLSLFGAIRELSNRFGYYEQERRDELKRATINIPIESLKRLDSLTLHFYTELIGEFSHDRSNVQKEAEGKMIEIITTLGINSFATLSYIDIVCRGGNPQKIKKLLTPVVINEIHDIMAGNKDFVQHPNPEQLPILQGILEKMNEYEKSPEVI